jgi:hypothetical protein
MMPSEFECQIGHPLPPQEWPVIQQIYAYSPEIRDVGGKDQIAQAYTTYGFEGIASRMLAEANDAAEQAGTARVHREVDFWYGTEVVRDDGVVLETRPKTLREVGTYLRTELGTLIDEYFSFCPDTQPDTPWPINSRWIGVFPVTGGSEGWYVHVEAITPDGNRQPLYLLKTFRGWNHACAIAKRIGELLYV